MEIGEIIKQNETIDNHLKSQVKICHKTMLSHFLNFIQKNPKVSKTSKQEASGYLGKLGIKNSLN